MLKRIQYGNITCRLRWVYHQILVSPMIFYNSAKIRKMIIKFGSIFFKIIFLNSFLLRKNLDLIFSLKNIQKVFRRFSMKILIRFKQQKYLILSLLESLLQKIFKKCFDEKLWRSSKEWDLTEIFSEDRHDISFFGRSQKRFSLLGFESNCKKVRGFLWKAHNLHQVFAFFVLDANRTVENIGMFYISSCFVVSINF